jgi:hypothetical protein
MRMSGESVLKYVPNIKVNYKLVVCYWHDILSVADWCDFEDAAKRLPVLCVTIGWLIYDTAETVVITNEINTIRSKVVDQVGNTTSIPKGCIVKMKTLRTKI